MNVDILDTKSFSALDPFRIERYLTTRGWSVSKRTDDEVLILESYRDGEKSRVWLPMDRSFVDLDESIGLVVKELAKAERRSQLEIFEDLSTIAVGDVVRLKTYDPFNRESTTIPISDGLALIEKAKRIATAAALSTEDKKPLFSSFRTPRVSEFIDNVRLGQTETGSYKLKLISPLPLQPNLPGTETSPFQRRVIINLMDSLQALKHVAIESLRSGMYRFDAYEEIVSEGVSANLCEALTEHSPKHYQQPLEVSVTWSTLFDDFPSPAGPIEFHPDVLGFIEQAGRDFRERNPEHIILKGFVVRLEKVTPTSRKNDQKIVIFGLVDDKYRKIHVELVGPDANVMAIEAYKQGREIQIGGILTRKGTFFNLQNASDVHFADNV